jgi:hypothetical protein
VHGLAGEPAHAGPETEPLRQIGHGCLGADVRSTFDVSAIEADVTPVEMSMVPLAGAENLFATHVDSAPFRMGSGGPKLQPVFVQSNPAPAAVVGPSLHEVPVHDSVKRFVEPSGVVDSGTVDWPPPMSSPPHENVSTSSVAAASSKTVPQSSDDDPVVKSRNDAVAVGWVVVVTGPVLEVVVASAPVVEVVEPPTQWQVESQVSPADSSWWWSSYRRR